MRLDVALFLHVDDTTSDRAMKAQSRACVDLEARVVAQFGDAAFVLAAPGIARWIEKATPEDIIGVLSRFDPLLRRERNDS